jgi:hypothetical protein
MKPINVSVTSRGVPFETTVDCCLTRDARNASFHIDEPPARTPHRVLRLICELENARPNPNEYPGIGGVRFNWNRRFFYKASELADIIKAIYIPSTTMLREFWDQFVPQRTDNCADPAAELDAAYNWSISWLMEAGRGVAGGTPPRTNPRLLRFWNRAPTEANAEPDRRNTAGWQPAIGNLYQTQTPPPPPRNDKLR